MSVWTSVPFEWSCQKTSRERGTGIVARKKGRDLPLPDVGPASSWAEVAMRSLSRPKASAGVWTASSAYACQGQCGTDEDVELDTRHDDDLPILRPLQGRRMGCRRHGW